MGTPVYDVDYFIKKFKAIPDEKWCRASFGDAISRCVMGHCGMVTDNGFRETAESEALVGIFNLTHVSEVFPINDGTCPKYKQSTPKARILAALSDIKEGIT